MHVPNFKIKTILIGYSGITHKLNVEAGAELPFWITINIQLTWFFRYWKGDSSWIDEPKFEVFINLGSNAARLTVKYSVYYYE